MLFLPTCLHLLFCIAFQGTPAGEAQFRIERPVMHMSPAKQAILLNAEGSPVVFRLTFDPPAPAGARIRAALIGPSLSTPIVIDQAASMAMISLPRNHFQEAGIYELTDVRLESAGTILNFASPQSAEIQVSQEFVVTEVTVEPLSEQDLLDLGYIFNPEDYVAVSFQLGLSIETKPERVDVSIPVVFPRHNNSTFRPKILADPFTTFQITPIIIPSPDGPNVQGDPVFPPIEEAGDSPPLMGLLLIPGQLKYLRSHFAVTCVLMNAAPDGFAVRAANMMAQLRLPLATPAGLPLTIQEPTQQVMINLGRDGTPDTADDTPTVDPGQQARAKYVITGNVAGFHDFEVLIRGDLQLPQGKETFATRTKAAVYVRSPDYGLSFEHPDAVESDEAYDFLVRITNTGQIAIDGFEVILDGDRLQGVRLADGQHPVQDLGTIPVGGEAIATYRLRSQVTGKVVAGYVKINQVGQPGQAVQLRVAVGDIGQRISPYVLNFAQVFFDRFPADLTDALKRHAKKALDTSMTPDHSLPDDLLPTASAAVRAMNRAFVRAAKGPDFGMSDRESLIRLFREWIHPRGGYAPLDHIRRKILNLNELPLETAFGAAFAARFNDTAQTFLTQLAQENEDLTDLHLFIIDTSGPIQITVNSTTGTMTNQGLRNLPLAGMLPLAAGQTLIWCSQPDDRPSLSITPLAGTSETITITGLSSSDTDGPRWLFQTEALTVDRELALSLDANASTAQLQPNQRPIRDYIGTPVPAKLFDLVSIAQFHRTSLGEADYLGRHHRLYFSSPVDLNSFYPLEDHLTINGEPIAFGELQSDQRTLIVTSQMPLGPYQPIAYRLHDVRARDGQVLTLAEGSYTGSASYRGVSIAGRVVDRQGTDLSNARAFLWLLDRVLDPEDPAFNGDPNRLVSRIVHTLNPDVNGRWMFDFAPTVPEPDQRDPFFFQTIKVGILLEDGRYQEQAFRPQGAGQVVAAEFAFLQLGTVQGQITSGGQPLPFTRVFVASENNPQSAEIVETDASGFYRVDDIQVGQILIKAAYQNQVGLIGGYLTAYNNPLILDLEIATPSANFIGTVTESVNGEVNPLVEVIVGYVADGRTFNRIYFERHNKNAKFVAITKTDATGQYQLDEVPAGQGEVWFYHRDFGLVNRSVLILENETQTVDYQFQFSPPATGTISGFVEKVDGQRISGARVSAGMSVTLSDTNGYFELDYIPKNRTQIVRANHPDWGSGLLGLFLEQDYLGGQTIIVYGPVPISGLYLDANGDPVPFTPVYMSYLELVTYGGYPIYSDYTYFGQTDFAGNWQGYGPKESIYRFTGFTPPEHAYATDISVGPLGQANVILQKSGLTDLRVRLIDSEGVPVIGKVDLKSLVPSAELATLGRPDLLTTRTDVFTDVNGYVTFTGLSTGSFEVFGHLGALGETETFAGILTQTPVGEPQTITLAFLPPEVPSNLFGTIYQPGGVDPAPDGTIVRLRGPGVNAYVIATLAGTYRFENLNLGQDPIRLELIAYNPNTQHFFRQWLDLSQDLDFRNDLILRKRMSVTVTVEHADGEPVPFAEVHADFLNVGHTPILAKGADLTGDSLLVGFTREISQVTPATPIWLLNDIPAGPLVLRANAGNGLVGLKRITLPLDRDTIAVTIRLETASQISGRFVDDQAAPITAAAVALKQRGSWLHQVLSDETPGSEGAFLFDALPMGRYELEGVDPATARRAHLAVTTSPFRPAPEVVLHLDPVGSLTGIARFEGDPVPNTTLVLRGKHFRITTGTDATGRFRFANLPLGNYNIKGHASAIPSRIFDEVQLSQADMTTTKDLSFGEVRDLHLNLLQPDGSPVADVLLMVYRGANQRALSVATSAYTNQAGVAIVRHLPLGNYRVLTERLNGATAVYQKMAIHEADSDPAVRTIELAGTGTLHGRVSDSLGQALNQPVHVRIAIQNVYGIYRHHTITTSADGTYRMGNVAVDRRIEISAYHPISNQADAAVIRLDHDGEDRHYDLSFLATTTVSGQVRFSDGTPAPFAVVWIESPLRNQTRANYLGQFQLKPVLAGETIIFVKDPASSRRTALPISITSSDGIQLDPLTDLELTLAGVAQLYGTIAFAVGDPTRYGSVLLEDLNSRNSLQVRIQGDGTYLFPRVPLGNYELTAYADRFGVETPPLPITLANDQASVQQDHLFDPSFSLTGTVFAPNRVDPVTGATISLWRQRSQRLQDGYERIYLGMTDASGAYQIDRVFPGIYLLKANNPDFSASLIDADFLMANADNQVPIYLETVIPLIGTLADASERPFALGRLTLLQDGQTTRLDLDPQGGFALANLRPTPYKLDYRLAGGWIEGSMTVNQPSADPVSLRTVDTVTLSGRAILAKNDPPSKPSVRLLKDGIARKLILAADGAFSLSRVPVNQPISLELRYNNAYRIIELGSFDTDTDLGDFYLDAIKPELSFPAENQIITSLPHTFLFTIAEDEPDSDIDPTQTAVWVNGKAISSQFLTDQTAITATFDLLPKGFIIGTNQVKVRVYNTSNIFRQQTFSVDVVLAGPSLVVDLRLGGETAAGLLQWDNQPWVSLADDGRFLIHNLTADAIRLKARTLAYGTRELVSLNQAATQFVTLEMHPIGSYHGRVFDIDGTPATNIPIYLNDSQDYEITDATGRYIFDLLPWRTHELWVRETTRFGFLKGPNILNPEQAFLGVDLQLDGFGTVTGTVLDDDGVTPVANATISLQYRDLAFTYPRSTTSADSQGVYRLENIMTRNIRITAKQVATQRQGYSDGRIAQPDDTLTTDILLQPTSTLTGTLVGLDGQPASGALVTMTRSFGDGELFAETITAASGSFTFTDIPRESYKLKATRDVNLEFLTRSLTFFDQAWVDLGMLQMDLDQPPTGLQVKLANPYHPGAHRFITIEGDDDRTISHWTFTLSGAFDKEFSGTHGPRTLRYHIQPRIPRATPDATLLYRLEVWDHLEQSTVLEGDIALMADQFGPNVSLLQPQDLAVVWEGQSLAIKIEADDPSGITSVAVNLNGVEIGVETGLYGTESAFSFTAIAPDVSATTLIPLSVMVTDEEGNLTRIDRMIQVTPIISSGVPQVTLLSPLPNQPMPLWLPQGLTLNFAADAVDPDGLGTYDIAVNGEVVASGALSGTMDRLETSYTLPPSLRLAASLTITWAVRDLGGNSFTTASTLNTLPGEWFVKSALDPLVLPGWYQSPPEERSVVLAGGEHHIDGTHDLDRLVLVNGAVLTQSASTAGDDYVANTRLRLTDFVLIDFGSRIDVDGKGYLQLPISLGLGVGRASHGGLAKGTGNLQQAYGSPFRPIHPGSHRGGGAIAIHTSNLWLLGSISASAVPTTNKPGSGGSIWLAAETVFGMGNLAANGFAGTYAESSVDGGGGGRIAIEAPGNLPAQAFGGKNAGAGTIFRRRPDPTQSSGYHQSLTVANHPQATTTNRTWIRTRHNLVVGTHVDINTEIIDNETRQVVQFLDPTSLPPGSFLGMRVFTDGNDLTSSPIMFQTATSLQSAHQVAFGSFVTGDTIAIDYQLDELIVKDMGWFVFDQTQPSDQIDANGGRLSSSETTINLGDLSIAAGDSVDLRGLFQTGNTTIDGSLILDGTLTTGVLTISTSGLVRTPIATNGASLVLSFNDGLIAGSILADSNGLSTSANDGLQRSHAGLGQWPQAVTSYGSLYQPETQGNSSDDYGGGVIALQFQTLNLTGSLDVTPRQEGSGGSIHLMGQVLTGNGPILARGGPTTFRPSGGGRIAIQVGDIDGFVGTTSVRGSDRWDSSYVYGGAGTVFYQTTTWPNGRLLIDNEGFAAPAGSTPLPGIGLKTVSAPTGGMRLDDSDLAPFNSLVGLYLTVDGNEPVQIVGQDPNGLIPATAFPNLAMGASYGGLHRLDVLEVRNGAKLRAIDPIEITQQIIIEGAEVDAEIRLQTTGTLTDGTGQLISDPGWNSLELDNYHLTVDFPLQLNQLILRNNSSLTYRKPVQATQIDVLAGSTLLAAVDSEGTGLTADSLTIRSGAIWTVADRKSNGQAYPLSANISGACVIEAGGLVSTSGANKVPLVDPDWAGEPFVTIAHGGLPRLLRQPDEVRIAGSFADPSWPGNYRGGGVIHIAAGSFTLDGHVQADGESTGTGGSIRIDSPSLTGSGRISAEPGGTFSGGGRIAIYYGSNANFLQTLLITTLPNNEAASVASLVGAGSLFVKAASQEYGDLIIDQQNFVYRTSLDMTERFWLTGITGLAEITLNLEDADADPLIIRDNSWTQLPPGLAGLTVATDIDGVTYRSRVTANSHNTIHLETPLPATLPMGTQLRFLLILDNLVLKNGAQLHFAGAIELGSQLILEGDHITSLSAQDLRGLPTPWVLSGRDFRLNLSEPTLVNHDLQLQQANLFLDRPITFQDLTLTDSWLQHSPWTGQAYATEMPYLDVKIRNLQADATSGFDVSKRVKHRLSANGYGSPRPDSGTPYGSLFQPRDFGSGQIAGGRIRIRAQSIDGGRYLARSNFIYSGGSIWIDAQTLTGTIEAYAGMTDRVSGAGGRIAVYYTDATQANLTTQAYGTAAGGTVYLKDHDDPLGNLYILGDNQPPKGSHPTSIPAFAPLTLGSDFSTSFDSATNTTDLVLPTLVTSTEWAGYHLVLNGDSMATIPLVGSRADASQTTLVLSGDYSSLQSGDTLQLAVVLDQFTVSAGTHLELGDLLLIYTNQYPANYVFQQGNGSFLEPPETDDSQLVLDQYDMVLHAAADYDHIELRNGATLTVQVPGSPQIPVLTGTSLTISDGLVAADHLAFSGAVTVAIAGRLEAYTDPEEVFSWPPGIAYEDPTLAAFSYGGLGEIASSNGQLVLNPTYGAFSQPWTVGLLRRALRLDAGSLHVDGIVSPDLSFDGLYNEIGGGALWITTGTLSGNGTIHVNIHPSILNNFPGGGRLAIYYTDMSTWQGAIEAFSKANTTSPYFVPTYRDRGASGTIYLKRGDQSFGDLHLVGGNQPTIEGSTSLVGLGRRTLGSQVSIVGQTLTDPDQVFPYSLADLYLVYDLNGTTYETRILANTANSITVADPLPDLLPGSEIRARLNLDNLLLERGAQLYSPDHLVVHGALQFGQRSQLPSVLWTRALTLASPNWVIADQAAGLAIEETTNLSTLTLDNSQLILDLPIELTQLNLVNQALVSHRPARDLGYRRYQNKPAVVIQADIIQIDATSAINVTAKGYPDDNNIRVEEMWAVANDIGQGHGGNAFAMGDGYAYGTPFQPESYGFHGGGGRIHLKADQLNLTGNLDASGNIGGSIWLELGSANGDGWIRANGGLAGGPAGSGGRIALAFDNNLLSQLPEAFSPVVNHNGSLVQYGAGTVYLYDRSSQQGTLILRNNNQPADVVLPSPIVGIGNHALAATPTDPQLIQVLGANWRYSLAGHLIVDTASGTTYRVLENTVDTLTLDRPIAPTPAPGWAFHGEPPIDALNQDQAQLASEDPVIDRTPPTITSISIEPLVNGILTGGLAFTVTVAANDNFGLANISVSFNGQTLQATAAPGLFTFTAPTPPQLTSYDLLITALDLTGLQVQETQTLLVESADQIAPQVTFLSPNANAAIPVTTPFDVVVQVLDAGLVDTIQASFNGQQQSRTLTASQQNGDHTFSFTAPFLQVDTALPITVTATDASANQASVTRTIMVTVTDQVIALPKPVAYFTLDEADRVGKYAYDMTRRHVATNDGATPNQVGQIGEAFGFISNDFIAIPNSEDLNVQGQAFSLSAWVNPYSQGDSHARILEKRAASDDNDFRFILKLQGYSEQVRFVVTDDNGNLASVTAPNPLPENTWSHVVAVANGQTIQLFIDGILVAETPWPYMMGTTTAPLYLGGSGVDSGKFLRGNLDEVGLWREPLSAAQVALLYQFGKNGVTPDFEPPEEVTDVLISPTMDQATLTWTASVNSVADLVGYRIFRDGLLIADNLSPATTQWIGSGLQPTTAYDWRITAFDALANESRGVQLGSITLDAQSLNYAVPRPVSGWTLDLADLQGAQVLDGFGSFEGTLTGGFTGETGQVAEALRFTTDNDRVEIAAGALLDDLQDNDYSLALWYKPDEIPSYTNDTNRHHGLLSKKNRALGLFYTDEQTFRFGHHLSNSQSLYLNSNISYQPGQFHHLVATVDRSNGIIRLYVDGRLNEEMAFTPNAISFNFGTEKWRLGEAGPSGYQYRFPAKGTLDQPKLWDRALTATEIVTLFQSENAGQAWDFTPPDEALDLSMVVASDQIDLTWIAAADPDGDRAGYRLWVEDATIPIELTATTTSTTVTGLQPASLVNLRLTAFDFSNNESPGLSTTAFTLAADGSLPALPLPLTHWRLDTLDNDGVTVQDVVGGHQGQINGAPLQVVAIIAEGLQFSDDNDAVVIPNHADLQNVQDGDYTLSAWFQPESIPSNTSNYYRHYALLMKQGSNMGLYYSKDGKFRMAHRLNSGGIYIDSKPVSPGQFYHVSAVVNRAAGTVRIYLDGTLQEEASFSPTDTIKDYGTNPWRLGEAGPASHTYRWPARGIMDDVFIWNQALTREQVVVLYQTARSGQVPTFLKTTKDGKGTPQVPLVTQLSDHGVIQENGALAIMDQHLLLQDYHSNENVILIGSQLELLGSLTLGSLELYENSLITLVHQNWQNQAPLYIRLEQDLFIDQGSGIDLDGVASGFRIGRPSHGGIATGGKFADLYDSPFYPSLPGGGAAGGGALMIEATSIELLGFIRSQGIGFSAGGAVQLHTANFSGDGLIDVRGGNDGDLMGGGGRIAVHALDGSNFHGQMMIGDELKHRGTLIFAHPDRSGISVFGHYPILFNTMLPIPILAHSLVYVYDLQAYSDNVNSLRWEITSPQDLRYIRGLRLRIQGQPYDIHEVTLLEPNRYLVQFHGHPPTPIGSRPFIILIDHAGPLDPTLGGQ